MLLDPNTPGVSRELWVDQATGTVLRTEERDASRGIVLTTCFSRIDSASICRPRTSSFGRRRARVSDVHGLRRGGRLRSADHRAGVNALVPPVLPDGYVFTGAAVSRFGALTSVYLRYSDGENLFSLFEAPAGSIGPTSGQTIQVGAASGRLVDLGYLRVLTWEQGGLHLTAVGTMPADTLVAIAGHLVGDQESALVQSVAQTAAVDPATVRALRQEGLTFPEIVRAVMLSRAVGTDVTTAVRYLTGGIAGTELAGKLDLTQAHVETACRRRARPRRHGGPHLTAPNP